MFFYPQCRIGMGIRHSAFVIFLASLKNRKTNSTTLEDEHGHILITLSSLVRLSATGLLSGCGHGKAPIFIRK
jgi:hypothetical protein